MQLHRTLQPIAALVLALVSATAAWAAAGEGRPSPLRLETLDGKPLATSMAVGPTIVAFRRADCGPCLIELRDARAYAAAARPGRLLFVGLQDLAALKLAATKAAAPPELVAHGVGEPAMILTAFGATPPRLPLAVALDRSGRICDRHMGLLGTDRVRAWAQGCEGPHARR